MKNYINNNNFFGAIDGSKIYDFSRCLDYKLNADERLELVEDILSTDKATEYFGEVFTQETNNKVNLLLKPKEDSLYSDSNVAKELSKMADYILFANKDNKDIEYKIYKDEQLFNKMVKEQSLDTDSQEETDNIIHFLLSSNKNYKKAVEQVVTKEDIEQISELEDYNKMLQSITYRLKKISLVEKLFSKTSRFTKLEMLTEADIELLHTFNLEPSKLNVELYKTLERDKEQLKKHSSLIKEDMKDIKDMVKGTIYFKQPLADSTQVDYDQFDWTNKAHIKELLKVHNRDLQSDLGCLVVDLDNLIKDTKLSTRDSNILALYREGLTLENIGNEINTSKQMIEHIINRIINNIINTYNKQYEDWYYLNIEKGTYKTCKSCNEVKLISNFATDSKMKDGHKNKCKACVETDMIVGKILRPFKPTLKSIGESIVALSNFKFVS